MRSNPKPSSRFSSQAVALLVFGVVFILGTSVRPVAAQGFSIESKSAPSVLSGGTFVSLEARFSIGLPQHLHGFRALAMDTILGRATGDSYNWTMKEASFTAGYVQASQAWDDPETSKRTFVSVRDSLVGWAATKNGKLVSEKQLELEHHPALELKFEFPDVVLFQRFYLVSHRLYQTLLLLKEDQRTNEAIALKVLDSFKILSDAEVSAALKAREAEAEPSPLPQEPFVPRVGTDAEDEGLHNKVKTVLQDSQDLSGTWSVQGRKPGSLEYYNERGNLTKRVSYDYKGNLSDITVYGFLDGMRVARQGNRIEREYNPPPMMIPSAPGAEKPKSDPRYSNKFTFQYDEQKRLIEKAWIMNNGHLSIRSVYKYTANQREELVYSADGSLNQHYLSVLDDKGNEVEQTSFATRDGSIRDKYSYTYEFDGRGNWTKRTTSKWVTKDGKSYYAPAYVDYRTITYY